MYIIEDNIGCTSTFLSAERLFRFFLASRATTSFSLDAILPTDKERRVHDVRALSVADTGVLVWKHGSVKGALDKKTHTHTTFIYKSRTGAVVHQPVTILTLTLPRTPPLHLQPPSYQHPHPRQGEHEKSRAGCWWDACLAGWKVVERGLQQETSILPVKTPLWVLWGAVT